MSCENCRRCGNIGTTLLFLVFALIFALLCAAGCWLLGRLPDNEASPVSGSAMPLIVIDAGHGGEDGGTVGINGTYEKDLNLSLSLTLRDILTCAGYRVVMTRTEDILLYDRNADYHGRKKVLDLAGRLAVAERYPEAVFLGIHMNAFPQSKYSGLQVYYSPNNPASGEWAKTIQSLNREYISPDNDRAAKQSGSNIFLLDRLDCPAVLIECGFLSNPEECARLCTGEYRRQLCLLIMFASGGQITDNNSGDS